MAAKKRKSKIKSKSASKNQSKLNIPEVKDYRFDEKRKNIPEGGLITYEKPQRKIKHYEYDPHLDPQLQWAGKKEHISFDVDTVPLHIHERVSTQAILKSVKRRQFVQTTLNIFAEPDLPLDKRIEFYQHDVDWSNRLILGDSLLVMNSLLEQEIMAGKVQMIYIDPPYGISYNSNFQPYINKRSVVDGDDSDLSREPEQIQAYRDTWELGIHSYLTYLRDRLLLSRELLTESGSCFVQISDENVHLVRCLMDEVFGSRNFVSLITVKKTSGAGSPGIGTDVLSSVSDYLIWYAKDINVIKYHQLYLPKGIEGGVIPSAYNRIELIDGTRRSATQSEKRGEIPKGARLYSLDNLTSQSGGESARFPIQFEGREFRLDKGSWKTSVEGIKRLIANRRIEATATRLGYVRYLDDFPAIPINNFWADVVSSFLDEKIYVVQTNSRIIQRCLLMTTDPGDLVLDPTCGSGTTAFVAEKWGRRWITSDTSRVAIALAKQRLMTAIYDFYELRHPEEGVRSGFKYKTIPHVTLKSIATNQPPQPEELYDQPVIDRSKVRVSGPFTVEAIPIPVSDDLTSSNQYEQNLIGRPNDLAENHVADMIELLKKTQNVSFPGGKKLQLENIRPVSGKGVLHAEAESVKGEKTRIAISFGPRHGPVTVRQMEEAISGAQWDYKILILAGFSFEPEVQAFIQKNPHPRLTLQLAHINPDVLVNDLLKTPKGSQIFSVFGQPDVEIRKKNDEYIVELKGVDIYDPITGKTDQSKGENVAAWFLDTDYDGYTFRISQAFFPNPATAKNPWDKLANALRGVVDAEKMEKFKSTVSLPFKSGGKKIAVKVIDLRGNEVIAVRELNGGD